MNDKSEFEYANKVAKQLEGGKTIKDVRYELKSNVLDDHFVNKIMIKATSILEDRYLPKIREQLLQNKEIHDSENFLFLESNLLDRFIKIELQKLADLEMNKIANLMKNNVSGEEILDQVDTRFLSLDISVSFINGLEEVQGHNKEDNLFLEDNNNRNSLKTGNLQDLADFEMSKIAKLVKRNVSGEEILDQVDTRYLSLGIAVAYINGLEEEKGRITTKNSGYFLMSSGIRLIIMAGIFYAYGKFSYSIPILVLYFLYLLFAKKESKYYS